jgi:acyl-coenzyme A synthetase/AMP-(fatty) acid ligase
VIFELLHKANAKALVYESDFAPVLRECPVPAYLARSTEDIDIDVTGYPLPELRPAQPEDIAFFFHTSGSSGGSPKVFFVQFHAGVQNVHVHSSWSHAHIVG